MPEDIEVHYPLTADQIRAKRLARDKQRILGTANNLEYERRMIKEEYERVSTIYARHLERLNAKMRKNVESMKALEESASKLAEAS